MKTSKMNQSDSFTEAKKGYFLRGEFNVKLQKPEYCIESNKLSKITANDFVGNFIQDEITRETAFIICKENPGTLIEENLTELIEYLKENNCESFKTFTPLKIEFLGNHEVIKTPLDINLLRGLAFHAMEQKDCNGKTLVDLISEECSCSNVKTDKNFKFIGSSSAEAYIEASDAITDSFLEILGLNRLIARELSFKFLDYQL